MLRCEAVSTVLKNLGEGTFEIIEQYLANVYGTTILEASKNPYSFEHVIEALNSLLGQRSAEIIIENMILEMDDYTEMWELMIKMEHRRRFTNKNRKEKGQQR